MMPCEDNPILTEADTLKGKHIDLQAITDLVIDHIKGNHIRIQGDGNILGAPLKVYIRGKANAQSDHGSVNMKNSYRGSSRPYLGAGPQTGDAAAVELYMTLSLLMLAILVMLRKKRYYQK